MNSKIQLAESQTPRYTSYPTAPHFSADIDARTHASWLEAAPADEAVSLYFHVPFCRTLCHYCGCHTKAVRKQEPVDAYARRIDREIELVAARLGGSRPVSHIHWGGGTPTIVGAEGLRRIVDTVHRLLAPTGSCEHAIELDPRYVSGALAREIAACGVNRVSLGVQDFNPRVQAAIGRIQPYDLVVAVVERLRRAGIERLNFDLMYGLPAQTMADLMATIERTIALRPSRVALFGYAHVPWFRRNQQLIDESLLPDTRTRLEQAEVAAETLEAAGYVPVGLDHFALPDDPLAIAATERTLRRNFQGYTTDSAQTLVGIGASSISQFREGYTQNDPATALWSRAIDSGTFATRRGYALTQEDRVRRAIIEQLMCTLEADPSAIARAHGVDPATLQASRERLRPLVDEGYVDLDGDTVRIASHARHLMRLVAVAFDSFHKDEPKRHARSV
ncbi:MAG: oxygen-independent coproporphyrinogen III oxidase [Flavobacteriaceae bacterium]